MEGRWFRAKNTQIRWWRAEGNNTRASTGGTLLTENHWSFVFPFALKIAERTTQQLINKGGKAGMSDRIGQYLLQMTSKLSHRVWTMICRNIKQNPQVYQTKTRGCTSNWIRIWWKVQSNNEIQKITVKIKWIQQGDILTTFFSLTSDVIKKQYECRNA